MTPRGNDFSNNGGRGRGRGRGASPFRGQAGRGYGQQNRGGGRGRPAYNNLEVIDVDIQRYADDSPASRAASPAPRARGRGGNRGRGRGRGTGTLLNLQVFNNGHRTPPPPRREDWSDAPTPAGRGSGRGPSRGLGARYNQDLPLSKLLALDRPYLRPINFIPAQLTPVLFQRQEELIEVHEFKEPEDHVPTAEQVSRVFSQQESRPPVQDSFFQNSEIDLFADADSEPVVTVDFGSLGKLLDDTSTSQSDHKPYVKSEDNFPPRPQTPETGQGMNIFNTIMQELSINSTETDASSSRITRETDADKAAQPLSHHVEETISVTTSQGTVIEIQEPEEHQTEAKGEEQPLFVVDANPTQLSERQADIQYTSASNDLQPLGSTLPEDDEIIVYVAPHPRSGRATPNIPSSAGVESIAHDPALLHTVSRTGSPNVSRTTRSPLSMSAEAASSTSATTLAPSEAFAGMSFSFDAITQAAQVNRQQTASPRARRLTKRDRQNRTAQWKGKKRDSFGTFGAMLEERHLYEDELELNGTQGRREGSDIDWGDGDAGSDVHQRGDNDDAEIERISSSLGGMGIDGNLEMHAMQSFVKSMSNKGMEYTRIDDIEDAEKLRLEDEEDGDSASGSEDADSEVEAVLKIEEERLVGEANGAPDSASESEDEEEEDASSDDQESAMQNFRTRLVRARQSAIAKGKMKETAFSAAQAPDLFSARVSKLQGGSNPETGGEDGEDEEDESDDFDVNFTWAEQDEDYIADLQDLLDEEDGILLSDRKQRKALFKSVLNGDFSVAPAKKKRDYGKDLPPELRVQWENDRAKKAENKAKRAAARLEVAADPFAKHKGGKKGRKAMLRAARLAEEEREEAPRQGPDIGLLVRQIRMYLDNLNITSPMALPPMDKVSRSKVHEIAAAFGLKSGSKGKGAARYITLIKTSRSGVQINERKIQTILRTDGEWGFTRPGNPGGGRGKGSSTPKHKEGDEVGKAAPKIGEGNVGFQLLAKMGWTEGEKIGVSGGLDAPLKAVFKSTKLGLGATR